MTSTKIVQPHHKWWFILGREDKLSAAEIAAVLNLNKGQYGVSKKSPLLFCPKQEINPQELIRKIGGTIKIAEEIDQSLGEEKMLEEIKKDLEKRQGKIIFGLSGYGEITKKQLESWGKEIKKYLKSKNLSVRFVPNKETTLSSATVDHNQLIKKGAEFIIYEEAARRFSLAKTIALQPYAEFSKRDFDRPGRDDKSGMLPPKLAMTLLNLSTPQRNDIILDPFCGSGTILTEAMLLGYNNLIGSDISPRAIEDTEKNIEWTKNNLNVSCANLTLYNFDVKDLEKNITPQSIDRIVTEPYLGKPLRGNENYIELETQSRELKNLYLSAFQVFEKILQNKGIVVFVFPRFGAQDKIISTNLKEEIEKMNFKCLPFEEQNYLIYQRPGQEVGREIWRFQKID